jgi:MFS family permease
MNQDIAGRLPRDLYVAAGARGASVLGNVIAVTALLLDFHDRGAGAWAVGGLLMAGALPIVLLAPVVGSLVDRFDSHTLIVVSSLWQAAACALLAVVDAVPQVTLVLVVLNACGTAVTNPLFLALTTAMVPNKQLAAANSVQQSAVTIATMVGPPVGGLLVGLTGGARVPLLLDTAVFVLVACSCTVIGIRRVPVRNRSGPNARAGIMMLFTDRVLAAVVALAVLLPVVVHLIYVAQVFLVRDSFGASGLTFGLLQATHTVGLLIGAVLASQMNTARRIVLGAPLSAAAMSCTILLIGVLHSLPVTFALYVVMGVMMSMVSVSGGTLLLTRTPEASVGRVMASFTAVHRTAGLVAYGIGGMVVGLWAPETVYVFSGAAALVIVLALVPVFRRAASLTSVPVP